MARGRKSQASLSVVSGTFDDTRPLPPGELSRAQAAIWRDVVAAMPGGWFGVETHPLLIQYCRHTVAAKHVAQLIAQAENGTDEFDISAYDLLLRMQSRESGSLATLGTKMRITQQSSWNAKTSGTAKQNERGGVKPWE